MPAPAACTRLAGEEGRQGRRGPSKSSSWLECHASSSSTPRLTTTPCSLRLRAPSSSPPPPLPPFSAARTHLIYAAQRSCQAWCSGYGGSLETTDASQKTWGCREWDGGGGGGVPNCGWVWMHACPATLASCLCRQAGKLGGRAGSSRHHRCWITQAAERAPASLTPSGPNSSSTTSPFASCSDRCRGIWEALKPSPSRTCCSGAGPGGGGGGRVDSGVAALGAKCGGVWEALQPSRCRMCCSGGWGRRMGGQGEEEEEEGADAGQAKQRSAGS